MNKEEWKNVIFEISGEEGAQFDEMRLTGWKIAKNNYSQHRDKNHHLHFYLKVVGFSDDNALNRSWGQIWDGIVQTGKGSLKEFLEQLL